jgi:hypothetical protein
MLKKLIFLTLTILIVSSSGLYGQGIKGKVVDIDGNPISYASIFIKELTRGTTSNSLGMFSLPLPTGEYHIYFRSLGYTEVPKTITLDSDMMDLQIIMPPQTYMIPEIRIVASGEDPAYSVMRKAIGLANYHLNQVKTYNAEIYIKGTAFFDKLPRAIAKRIEVNNIKVEEGQAYMLESINEVKHTAPDKYEMKVLASQNTLPGYVESVNPMDYINASLYQQQIESFVSPLARNAFSYYRYSFEGSFLQGNYMIDKIRVSPRRKSQQLCEGFLYIVEDLWCLHSSDLEVSTIAGTLYLQQLYANVIMDAWLPVSHKLEADVQIAGVKADVTYVSSLEYKKVDLNPNLPRSYFMPTTTKEVEPIVRETSREQEKILEIMEKDEMTDRDMARMTKLMEQEAINARGEENSLEIKGTKFTIGSGAVINDSIYWNEHRPVLLTPEEERTLAVRDSIMGFGGSGKVTSDSMKFARSKKSTYKKLVYGNTYKSPDRLTNFEHTGLLDLELIGFNTVDGIKYGQRFRFNTTKDRITIYRSELWAGYAFGRKAPLITWNSSILYAPKIRGKIALRLDYTSFDFNELLGIPRLTNAGYSLFYRTNYSKRYETINASLEHRMDLTTGLVLTTTIDADVRRQLYNNSDLSILYRKSRVYMENDSFTFVHNYDPQIFEDSKLLSGTALLEYTPKYYYRLRGGRKQYTRSDWPTFYIKYKHAVPVQATGWASYQLLSLGLKQSADVGLLSHLYYKLEGAYFFNANNMHFSDYQHFKTSPVMFDVIGFGKTFALLDYYRGSTNEYYVESHAGLRSPFLILKMLPWFSERLWTETLSLGYLYTPDVKNHIQLGYSVNDIMLMIDAGVYMAFEDWGYYGTAFKVNFRF